MKGRRSSTSPLARAPRRVVRTDASIQELLSGRAFAVGTRFAGERFAAGRAAELLAEDPTRTAQQLVDLLRAEADEAAAEFKRIRGDD